METEFSERLINVLEKKRLKKKLEGDLKAILDDLSAQTSRLDDLSAQLNREKVDVEKLESNSLAAIFYTVLGSREAQLEKERQEMLRAQLVYQNTKHQVASLEGERNYLLRKLARLEGVESKYETLLSEKEAYLRGSNPVVANKLVEISEQVANLNAEIKEIDEAIDVGSQVVLGLVQVLGSLNSAKSWGVWDMVGGGFLSTAVKHSRIDEARERVTQVQELMTRFKRELADVWIFISRSAV
jgi:chromosome segregation ATPase